MMTLLASPAASIVTLSSSSCWGGKAVARRYEAAATSGRDARMNLWRWGWMSWVGSQEQQPGHLDQPVWQVCRSTPQRVLAQLPCSSSYSPRHYRSRGPPANVAHGVREVELGPQARAVRKPQLDAGVWQGGVRALPGHRAVGIRQSGGGACAAGAGAAAATCLVVAAQLVAGAAERLDLHRRVEDGGSELFVDILTQHRAPDWVLSVTDSHCAPPTTH